MFLKRCSRRRTSVRTSSDVVAVGKCGKGHVYRKLVESVRTARGPRHKVVSYLGELTAAEERKMGAVRSGLPACAAPSRSCMRYWYCGAAGRAVSHTRPIRTALAVRHTRASALTAPDLRGADSCPHLLGSRCRRENESAVETARQGRGEDRAGLVDRDASPGRSRPRDGDRGREARPRRGHARPPASCEEVRREPPTIIVVGGSAAKRPTSATCTWRCASGGCSASRLSRQAAQTR